VFVKNLGRCLLAYLPIASLIVLLVWFGVVRGPAREAFLILPMFVLPPALAASMLLGPAFSRGHLEPLRRQQTVFTLTALLFLLALVLAGLYAAGT